MTSIDADTALTELAGELADRARPGALDRSPDPHAIDWKLITRQLVGRAHGPSALQRVIRDSSGEISDVEMLCVVADPGHEGGRIEGRRSSTLTADWDPERDLEPVRRALSSGRPTRHAIRLAGFTQDWYLLEIEPLGGDLLLVGYSELDAAFAEHIDLAERPAQLPPPEYAEELCLVAASNGRILHLSASLGVLLDRSVEEMAVTGLSGVLDVDTAARLIDSCGRLVAGTATADDSEHHLALQRADGSTVQTVWSVRYEPDVGVVAVGRDVTSRVEAERQLRSVLDAVESPVVLIDQDRAIYTNRARSAFTGREGADDALFDWHPDDRASIVAATERTRATSTPTTVEARLRRHDGVWRWMLETISLVEQADGALMVALAVDIHDQRLAQRRLSELVSLVPDTLFHLRMHPEPRLEFLGGATRQINGYSDSEHFAEPTLGYRLTLEEDKEAFRALGAGETDDIVVRQRHRDGSMRWISLRVNHERDDDGTVLAMTGLVRDVTRLKEIEQDLEHRASHDELTGLPNRSLLRDVLDRDLARWRRQPADAGLGVLFIDLDRFKLVNDTHGHEVGDALLRAVTARLRAVVRDGDTVARLGGDEFAVVIASETTAEVARVAERVLERLEGHLDAAGYEVYVAASGGLAFAGPTADTGGDLLRHADTALARAKERGRRRLELFDDGLRQELERRHRLEQELRKAVAEESIDVHHQPIVDLRTGQVVAVEALARWIRPHGATVAPADFVPLAEETGLITSLGPQVMKRSLAALARWHARGDEFGLSVNLSARQLSDDVIVDDVITALVDAGVDPSHLCVEVTETVLLTDGDGPARRLAALREAGVRVAVDDFGTGFSSLSYLDRLPIDILKIDRSFVARIDDPNGGATSSALARSIIELADALGFDAYAEGVETVAQRDRLVELGCRYGQGFLFAPALQAGELDDRLAGCGGRLGPLRT